MEPAKEQAYQRQIAELVAEVAALKAEVVRLAELIARLSKNSSNSSKPASSDLVKPPKGMASKSWGSKKKKRKIGGQPGHAKHAREPFPRDELDGIREYELCGCLDCGGRVSPRRTPARVVQQVELIVRPIEIMEHRAQGGWCRRCLKLVHAPLPAAVDQGGLLGPQLTALAGYLKGVCHASFSTIRKYFRDVLKISISRGPLAKVIGKVSTALAPAYEALRARLPLEARLNVDETGHKNNRKPHGTWCFRAEGFTLFKIDASRGSDVLIDVLGEGFNGVLGCDYFSAYRKYMTDFSVAVQFCLAHFIREVKFLQTLPGKRVQVYAQRLLDALRGLFRIFHHRETMTPESFQRALDQARTDVIDAALWAPRCAQAQNLAQHFRLHGAAYFRFITTPGIEPTNILAEQAIRFVVIDRRITQGTRSPRGQRWCERIRTVIATCAQQGRSVFEYLRDTLHALSNHQPIPSLVPAGP